jgi:hypothetical protein
MDQALPKNIRPVIKNFVTKAAAYLRLSISDEKTVS